jgi:hypothetical protein
MGVCAPRRTSARARSYSSVANAWSFIIQETEYRSQESEEKKAGRTIRAFYSDS